MANKDNTNTAIVNQTTTEIGKYNWWKSSKTSYDKRGVKNKTNFPKFVSLCKLTQKELKCALQYTLKDSGYEVINGDGYLYARGDIPVLLTAHMDTVHKKTIKDYYEYYDKEKNQHILSSPQGLGGDDRCGIYMILQIIKTHKCSILFCEDEEVGGKGSAKFCRTELVKELESMKYLVELDRANANDAVFYRCDNPEFTKFIEDNTGYTKARGSFTDIVNLSDTCRVASVNLSCGYYNAHTTSEYVIVEEMLHTIDVVKKLLDVECESFEFMEKQYNSYSGYGSYGNQNYQYYNDDWNIDYCDNFVRRMPNRNIYGGSYGKSLGKHTEIDNEVSYVITIYDEVEDVYKSYVANATNLTEAFGKFFMANTTYCFDDIFDWEKYDLYAYEDGWYTGLY